MGAHRAGLCGLHICHWRLAYLDSGFSRACPGDFPSEATVNFGTIVVVTVFIGTLSAAVGDYVAKRIPGRPYFWLSPLPRSLRAVRVVGPDPTSTVSLHA